TLTMAAAIPDNFSWVEKEVLAACAFPSSMENVQYMIDHNIYTLVSLTAEKQVCSDGITDEFQVIRIPFRDYTPPTLEQVELFLEVVRETKSKARIKALTMSPTINEECNILCGYAVPVGTYIFCHIQRRQPLFA
uniref:Swiss Army Knife protein DSP-PTPase phosphatase domain-containing protein n=1 Tax=Biomphalaria glabrata TaxID=6526 RepID=A0A2C9LKA9_BIOGL